MASRNRFDNLVNEEIPIQKASTSMEYPDNGMPSCLQLFDIHMMCMAIRSQFSSLYRFGHMSDCSRALENWKYCLSMRGLEPERRKEEWVRRRAEWWASRRMGPNSEDVWESRNYPPDVVGKGMSGELLMGQAQVGALPPHKLQI